MIIVEKESNGYHSGELPASDDKNVMKQGIQYTVQARKALDFGMVKNLSIAVVKCLIRLGGSHKIIPHLQLMEICGLCWWVIG